jgi:hypothetical protein
MTLKLDSQARRNLTLYARGEFIIARGKFQQLRQQARDNQAVYNGSQNEDVLFLNSGKAHTPINTTKELASELQTGEQTASRIIQIQAK